jgi:hypothetical protein
MLPSISILAVTTSSDTTKGFVMAILREWRAEIQRELKTEYVEYIRKTGIVEYQASPGNLGAAIATRDLDEHRTEVVTLSWWTDAAAIQTFAGEDIGRARYFPEDDRFLLTRPERVQHYDSTFPAGKARNG